MTFGPWQFDMLSLIGLVIIAAYLATKGVQRVGVPQVVGFILVGVSLILALMTMGVVVANLRGDNSLYVRRVVERVGPPIYMLFFALVGARLQLSLLPAMGTLGGAWLGSHVGGAEPQVRKYLGLGLLSQAGVAIGLALSIADRFDAYGQQGGSAGHDCDQRHDRHHACSTDPRPDLAEVRHLAGRGAWQRHLGRGKTQSWVERAALTTAACRIAGIRRFGLWIASRQKI